MKKLIFQGAATALITPMHSDGTINYEKLKELTENQIQNGIDALVACGTTGESATVTYDEHISIIKTVAEQAAGRVPVIAGAGSNDTARAVVLAKNATDAGADALLMVTPFYNKTSQIGLIAHYNYIADRTELPVILYNVPSRTGVNIKPETYKELSKHPNIIAAKEANGDIGALAQSIDLCEDNLTFYSGNDDQIVPFLSLGSKGVISVLSNLIPRQTHKMCLDYFEGNTTESAKAQIKYIQLIKLLFSDVNPIPVKEAMNIIGFEAGPTRLPLYPIDEKLKQMLKQEIERVL